MTTYNDFLPYQNIAKQNVIFTKFATKTSAKDQEELQKIAKEIAPNHELLLFSDYFDDSKSHQYRCAVFVDHENKEIVFANAGTRFKFNRKGWSDIKDDFLLILQSEPKKIEAVKKLNKVILDNLGEKAPEYKFHATGHSLGAAIAQIQATDLLLQANERGYNIPNISTLTFDNPGAKPIVNKMLDGRGVDRNAIKHVVVNNRPNLINTLNPQIGEVFQLVPSDQKPINRSREAAALMFGSILKALPNSFAYRVLKRACQKIASWFSYGSLSKQIKEHKLRNFDEVLVQGGGNVVPLSSVVGSAFGQPIYSFRREIQGIKAKIQKYFSKKPNSQSYKISHGENHGHGL